MINLDIPFLEGKVDNGTVKINFVDGETVTAKIIFVSETEKDIIFDIISSNRSLPLKEGVIRATFDEIESVVNS